MDTEATELVAHMRSDYPDNNELMRLADQVDRHLANGWRPDGVTAARLLRCNVRPVVVDSACVLALRSVCESLYMTARHEIEADARDSDEGHGIQRIQRWTA